LNRLHGGPAAQAQTGELRGVEAAHPLPGGDVELLREVVAAAADRELLTIVRRARSKLPAVFFFIPTGSTSVITLVIAGLCVALFAWTGLLETRPPPKVTFAEASAYAEERPYLLDQDFDGPLPEPAVLAEERREFEALVIRGLDKAGGAERKLSLVPSHGFLQVGWLTNLFVHFSLFHLLGNLLFLWLVGPLLEEAWGRWRFLAFYLCAGLVASLVQFLISRASASSIGGASGAIAGCMGAFALRFAMTRIRFHYFLWFIRIFVGSVHVPAWICGALWFGRELLDLKDGGASGVATGAHVGGFALGGLVALGMRALGAEKALLTVAESDAVRARQDAPPSRPRWWRDSFRPWPPAPGRSPSRHVGHWRRSLLSPRPWRRPGSSRSPWSRRHAKVCGSRSRARRS
jgi:membrane associated rhomboid family serine protease